MNLALEYEMNRAKANKQMIYSVVKKFFFEVEGLIAWHVGS